MKPEDLPKAGFLIKELLMAEQDRILKAKGGIG